MQVERSAVSELTAMTLQTETAASRTTVCQSSIHGRYDVFISHAGAQKDFALWVRSHVRICGYRAFVDERDLQCVRACSSFMYHIPAFVRDLFAVRYHAGFVKNVEDDPCARRTHAGMCCPSRYGDHAPREMETALRNASVVLVVVSVNFLRSKFCLEELQWACGELEERSLQGQQPCAAFMLVPIFYHDRDPAIGFGIDSFQRSTLQELLRCHHPAASKSQREQWLDALLVLAERTGIRQDSTGRCDGTRMSYELEV